MVTSNCNGHWAKKEFSRGLLNNLKLYMCARFVPPYYWKELLLKLQWLHQGFRSVNEYFKDLEITLTKINMYESKESKIARFVTELRREIQDVVELYEYTSLEKFVHLAIKVESQVLKRNSFKNTHNDGFTNHLGRTNKKFKTKTLLPISQKKPPHIIKILKINLLLLFLNHPAKPQVKNALNI